MPSTNKDFAPNSYNPKFNYSFLAIKHWGTWLGIMFFLFLSILPLKIQQAIARLIANFLAKKTTGVTHKIRVNLQLCFGQKSFAKREDILKQTLFTATLFMIRFSLVTLRSSNWLQKQCEIKNLDILLEHVNTQENVILLVPHSWAIDIGALLLITTGLPVVTMVKEQKNPVSNWLLHRQRVKYGNAGIYEREGGIKPFLKAIREGNIGYYLPDQDHGIKHSVFADFFNTPKATLAGIAKIAKLSKSSVLPLFVNFNNQTAKFEIEILPKLRLTGDEQIDAKTCNETIEYFLCSKPEQYMWMLQFFKSQPDGVNYYHQFKDRYQKDWFVTNKSS